MAMPQPARKKQRYAWLAMVPMASLWRQPFLGWQGSGLITSIIGSFHSNKRVQKIPITQFLR